MCLYIPFYVFRGKRKVFQAIDRFEADELRHGGSVANNIQIKVGEYWALRAPRNDKLSIDDLHLAIGGRDDDPFSRLIVV